MGFFLECVPQLVPQHTPQESMTMGTHLSPHTDGQWQVQGRRAQTEEQGVGRTVTVDVIHRVLGLG